MKLTQTPLVWQLGHTASLDIAPAAWIPATVPGAVQLDWAAEQQWPQPEYDHDLSKYDWMEDEHWVYRTTLNFQFSAHERCFFVCKGIDYRFIIRLNGATIHEQEGMFTAVEIELTQVAKNGDVLEVVIFPAPKSRATPINNKQADACCKPAITYGGDNHPRMVSVGIWDETYLETRPAAFLQDAELRYSLSEDLLTANLSVDVAVNVQDITAHSLRWTLTAPDGALVAEQKVACSALTMTFQAVLEHLQLWWPHDQGGQPLYQFTAELCAADGLVIDRRSQRVGFRRARLVMHPRQWQEKRNNIYPKTRNTAPITLEINGRPIFAKGANWVTPTLYPGMLNADLYREQLGLAKGAHMNILRCWGGANVQKESFFDLCDAMGILLWQEFPLSCNAYPDTPQYLAVLDQESRSIIRRVRRHVSLVIWCGGNELFNAWSKMTDQGLPLRLLNKNCYEMDQATPFLMTSPVDGMAHGGYFFWRKEEGEVYAYFAASSNTAYTEFGVPGPADLETLKKIIPESELFPPKIGTQWETRKAIRAWNPDSWLNYDSLVDYFGEFSGLEAMLEASNWQQCEGLKAIYEEARRQKPTCSMALNWCFNEAWPNAANNSIVTWPSRPKPALAAVGEALRPVLASARIAKFKWQPGEVFRVRLFLLNDAPEPFPGGLMEAELQLGSAVFSIGSWNYESAAANTNLVGPEIETTLPDRAVNQFTLRLRVPNHPATDSSYLLMLTQAAV